MDKRTVPEILHTAEAEIAELATDAAKNRDYERAERLLGVARQLAATADRFTILTSTTPSVAPSLATAPTHASNDDDGDDDAPVFERDGNELIKTGKSRDGKAYEHKAPHGTIDALLQSIADKSTKRGEFRTSRIFPLLDAGGRKLPTYQGYLCLRWLRQIGLVHRVARQRYQMVDGRDPSTSVETAWQSLHQRGT